MRTHPVPAHRAPAEPIDRTTRRGADQYVLACNARRDAGDVTFGQIELLEREVAQLREAVRWKAAHASTRTSRWVWARVIVITCVLAGLAGIGGWMFTPNGRTFRNSIAEGYHGTTDQAP